MAIPTFQLIMLPMLKTVSDDKDHKLSQVVTELANEFSLSPKERISLLPDGKRRIFDHRVGAAQSRLTKAGLLYSSQKGYLAITREGLKFIKTNPSKMDISTLEQFPEYHEYKKRKKREGKLGCLGGCLAVIALVVIAVLTIMDTGNKYHDRLQKAEIRASFSSTLDNSLSLIRGGSGPKQKN